MSADQSADLLLDRFLRLPWWGKVLVVLGHFVPLAIPLLTAYAIGLWPLSPAMWAITVFGYVVIVYFGFAEYMLWWWAYPKVEAYLRQFPPRQVALRVAITGLLPAGMIVVFAVALEFEVVVTLAFVGALTVLWALYVAYMYVWAKREGSGA